MAWTEKLLYITWNFAVSTTAEIAQFGLHGWGVAGYDPEDTVAAIGDSEMDDLADAFHDMVSVAGYYWANYSVYTGVKVAALGLNGEYIAAPKYRTAQTAWTGSAAQIVPQTSVCVTTMASSTFGKGKRGRFYIPHSQIPLDTAKPTGSSGGVQDIADAAAAFIGDVNGILAGIQAANHVVIPSEVTGASPQAVTAVRVGNVNDTQRRRRNNMPETYETASV